MPTALITGASSGIGEALATHLSHHYGYSVILVARREDRLQALASSLSTPVQLVVADLGTAEGLHKVCEVIRLQKPSVVINNAGFGLIGPFASTDLEVEQNMIDVNVSALHHLMKVAVQVLREVPDSHILNVGSVAGYYDGPYMSTYFATKNYVRALTRAVAVELKRDRVPLRISLLAPGPVRTEFGARANKIDRMNGKAQATVSLSAEFVARYALKKMFKGKLDIIPGWGVRLGTFMMRFVPPSLIRYLLVHYYH